MKVIFLAIFFSLYDMIDDKPPAAVFIIAL